MELDFLIKELESNYAEQQCLKQKAEELKEKIYEEMVACRLERFNTPNIKVSLARGYKFEIPRDQSEKVYELLEKNGYDCKTYNSTQRTKYINQILEENDELPEWLLGRVKTIMNKTLKITKRGELVE